MGMLEKAEAIDSAIARALDRVTTWHYSKRRSDGLVVVLATTTNDEGQQIKLQKVIGQDSEFIPVV